MGRTRTSLPGPDTVRRLLALCIYLTSREFDRRFAGSLGGKIWMFASPLATIAVIGSAVHFGFGPRTNLDSRYAPSLALALCGWVFFADAINASTNSIVTNPHLVKKVVFPVELLPISATLAVFFVHLCVLAAVVSVLLLQGMPIQWSILSLPVWTLCLVCITSGMALGAAGTNVVMRDMSAIVPNLIGLLFWVTPIVWPVGNMPPPLQIFATINPLSTIFNGYRHALLGSPAPLSPTGTAVFMIGSMVFTIVMLRAFQRTRHWFSNVL